MKIDFYDINSWAEIGYIKVDCYDINSIKLTE